MFCKKELCNENCVFHCSASRWLPAIWNLQVVQDEWSKYSTHLAKRLYICFITILSYIFLLVKSNMSIEYVCRFVILQNKSSKMHFCFILQPRLQLKYPSRYSSNDCLIFHATLCWTDVRRTFTLKPKQI